MITKDRRISSITVGTGDIVFVRYDDVMLEDGKPVGTPAIHRESFMPGADVSEQPQRVRDFCAVAWK